MVRFLCVLFEVSHSDFLHLAPLKILALSMEAATGKSEFVGTVLFSVQGLPIVLPVC